MRNGFKNVFLNEIKPLEGFKNFFFWIPVRTESNAIMAVLILWLVIVLSCIPAFFSHGVDVYVHHDRNTSVCLFQKNYNQVAFQVRNQILKKVIRHTFFNHRIFLLQVSFFLTSYVIPLALICGLYLFMLLRLWRNAAPGGRVSEEGRRGRKRVTRMVVVIVAIFAISWFPIQVCSFSNENLIHWKKFPGDSCIEEHGHVWHNKLPRGIPDFQPRVSVHEFLRESHSLRIFVREFPQGFP